MREIRIGLIGLGSIGKVHLLAYRAIPLCFDDVEVIPRVTALLRSPTGSESAAQEITSIPTITRDPQVFFDQPLDLVDICTPNNLHLDYAVQALKNHTPVYCEKPLANNLADAQKMEVVARQAGVLNQITFMYHYMPAIHEAKALFESGAIGELVNFRAVKLHSSLLDQNRPISWRMRMKDSGGGAMMDIGIHMLDMVRYVLGDFQSLQSEMRTLIKNRPIKQGSSEKEVVDVDDWALCLATLKNGGIGTIEVSKLSAGDEERTTLEIYGTRGTVVVDAESPRAVRRYDLKEKQWLEGASPVMAIENLRPIQAIYPSLKLSQGAVMDRHIASSYDILLNLLEGLPSSVDFADGLIAQELVDACYRSAQDGGRKISFAG